MLRDDLNVKMWERVRGMSRRERIYVKIIQRRI